MFTYTGYSTGGAGSYRTGVAGPASEVCIFTIQSIMVHQGAVSAAAPTYPGVVPAIGEFVAKLRVRGYEPYELGGLSVNSEFLSIEDAQYSPMQDFLTVRLSMASSAEPGDYPVWFTFTDSHGETVQTANQLTITVLDPAAAAQAVGDMIALLAGSVDKAAFIARLNSQIIGPLGRIQADLGKLFDDGFTDQAQDLLDLLAECRGLTEEMVSGSSAQDVALVTARLNSAVGTYVNQIIPAFEAVGPDTPSGQFNSLVQALESAESSLDTAVDYAHPALAEAISTLATDSNSLKRYVHAFAQCVLAGEEP
jgi:hypothetical protein